MAEGRVPSLQILWRGAKKFQDPFHPLRQVGDYNFEIADFASVSAGYVRETVDFARGVVNYVCEVTAFASDCDDYVIEITGFVSGSAHYVRETADFARNPGPSSQLESRIWLRCFGPQTPFSMYNSFIQARIRRRAALLALKNFVFSPGAYHLNIWGRVATWWFRYGGGTAPPPTQPPIIEMIPWGG
jgi:hypothetical protein